MKKGAKMNMLGFLKTQLLDLLGELDGHDIPLTIGGGFGLFLKREALEQRRTQTLFENLPEARATNDIDLFIRVDVLADFERTKVLADAIGRLNYEPIRGAEFMQWKKEALVAGVPREIKLDFLVGPLGTDRDQLHLKGSRRARPRSQNEDARLQFHASRAEEALHIDKEPFVLEISGTNSHGEDLEAEVFVPHSFPYLMMKLCAFHDRKNDERKDLGRHHAMDLYRIVGTMVEQEYNRTLSLAREYHQHEQTRRVAQIVEDDFATPTTLGLLRLREHPLFREGFQLNEFIEVLGEVFTPT